MGLAAFAQCPQPSERGLRLVCLLASDFACPAAGRWGGGLFGAATQGKLRFFMQAQQGGQAC